MQNAKTNRLYFVLYSQRLADTLESKDEELQMKDRDLSMKVQDLMIENAELRNQVASLKEGGSGSASAGDSPPPHPPKKQWNERHQRTPATSCDYSGEFDCETTIVHLLASHCSVVSSRAIPSTPPQRSVSLGLASLTPKKLPKIRQRRGSSRRSSSQRPPAWVHLFSSFIPRSINRDHRHDEVSDLSSSVWEGCR